MKNIFVEGIQGAGKSTLVGCLAKALPRLRVCREGDYSPVDLAWCAWMTPSEHAAMLERFPALKEEILRLTTQEGGRLVTAYTKIRTDDRSVYRAFEDYEIYNGRKTLEEFREIVFARYEAYRGTGGLFECAFFQNIIEELMLYQQLSDEEIVDFYRELYSRVNREEFLLLYLYSDHLRENIAAIRRERCDAQGREIWYEMLLSFFTGCPYGKAHGYTGFDDIIEHLCRRQQLEMRIIREVIGERAVVLVSRQWDAEAVAAQLA